MALIQGTEFSLFWDKDREMLRDLPFSGRVEWLEKRIDQILIGPLKALEMVEKQRYVWLAVTELICAGIESLAGFYGDGRHPTNTDPDVSPFCRFVHRFMHGDFSRTAESISEGSWTYCEHLHKYFRGGLDHGFGIEWGGLWHDGEDGTHGYLRPAADGKGIAIDPRKLLDDFCLATQKYFSALRWEGEKSLIGENFQNRFNRMLEYRSRNR